MPPADTTDSDEGHGLLLHIVRIGLLHEHEFSFAINDTLGNEATWTESNLMSQPPLTKVVKQLPPDPSK